MTAGGAPPGPCRPFRSLLRWLFLLDASVPVGCFSTCWCSWCSPPFGSTCGLPCASDAGVYFLAMETFLDLDAACSSCSAFFANSTRGLVALTVDLPISRCCVSVYSRLLRFGCAFSLVGFYLFFYLHLFFPTCAHGLRPCRFTWFRSVPVFLRRLVLDWSTMELVTHLRTPSDDLCAFFLNVLAAFSTCTFTTSTFGFQSCTCFWWTLLLAASPETCVVPCSTDGLREDTGSPQLCARFLLLLDGPLRDQWLAACGYFGNFFA